MSGDDQGVGSSGPGEVVKVVGAVSNVVPIDSKKKKPRQTPVEQAEPYIDALLEAPAMEQKYALPVKFKVLRDIHEQCIILKVDDDLVCRVVRDSAVEDAVLCHSKTAIGQKTLSPQVAKIAARVWAATAEPLREEDIASVAEKSDARLCWHRLPWDIAPGETPLFDEMFSRIDNAQALREWIGSLLVDDSDRQHYAYLWGHGNDGKGALLGFLYRVFGPAYRAEIAPRGDNRFWTYGLIGARLVALSEGDANFVTSRLFKQITGGDSVRVEQKGGGITTMKLNCKIMIASNDRPKVTGSIADQRRIIYCAFREMERQPTQRERNTYEARLWQEGAAFLWKCREAYRDMMKVGDGYTLIKDAIEEVVAANEEEHITFFENNFELGTKDDFVLPADIQSRFDLMKFTQAQKNAFYAWLLRTYKIKIRVSKDSERRSYRSYPGMRIKGSAVASRVEGHSGAF